MTADCTCDCAAELRRLRARVAALELRVARDAGGLDVDGILSDLGLGLSVTATMQRRLVAAVAHLAARSPDGVAPTDRVYALVYETPPSFRIGDAERHQLSMLALWARRTLRPRGRAVWRAGRALGFVLVDCDPTGPARPYDSATCPQCGGGMRRAFERCYICRSESAAGKGRGRARDRCERGHWRPTGAAGCEGCAAGNSAVAS